jgi:hypothetical protein
MTEVEDSHGGSRVDSIAGRRFQRYGAASSFDFRVI